MINKARNAHHSGAMADLLNQGASKPKSSVNHMKANMQKLKDREEEINRKQEEASRMPNEPFKMKKFQNV